MRPAESTYPPYYGLYIPLVKENHVLEALQANSDETIRLIAAIPAEKEEFAYADGKWTVKQVISHIIDTERIFSYRALRFARKDPQQPLPFEEDHYAASAELAERHFSDLLEEFEAVRRSSILLFKSFSDSTLLNQGHTAIGDTSVLALGFLICGHTRHHLNVLRERYLDAL